MILRVISKIKRLLWIKRAPIEYARSLGVNIGEGCRIIGLDDATFGSEPYLITLGNHVTITAGVSFVTHEGGVWVFREENPEIDIFAPIVIGNNVFIGINTIIMPGVIIGNDCVVGAGSIVTKDIPDGTIVAGVPAVPIMTMKQYREKSLRKALNVRSMSPAEKKKYLINHFNILNFRRDDSSR